LECFGYFLGDATGSGFTKAKNFAAISVAKHNETIFLGTFYLEEK
jgi:hypothetical protein